MPAVAGDPDKDRSYWERHARRYDSSVAGLSGPWPRMLELIEEATSGAGRVLEVAAGTGLITPVLAAHAGQVVATDYAGAMVKRLQARVRSGGIANVTCARADIYALPFAAGSFDVVVAANVLHLLPDLPAALAALRRMLGADGVLVAPTFCHDETVVSRIVSRLLSLSGFPGQRRFSARSLREALESAGLVVKRAETLRGLLPIGYVDGAFAPA